MLKENEKEFICEVEIPLFVESVRVSEKRRKTYYSKSSKKKIPKRYQSSNYEYKPKGKDKQLYLFDSSTKEFVISNPKSHGTPRKYFIRGNDFYSGNINEFTRIKVAEKIKEQFYEYIKDLEFSKKLPIVIECGIYYPLTPREWDIDNKVWIYNKCLQDLLVSSGVIEEDNRLFITQSAGGTYFPVDSIEDRKLVYRFSYDLRMELQQLRLNLYGIENNKEDF